MKTDEEIINYYLNDNMIAVEGGTFMMGSADISNAPVWGARPNAKKLVQISAIRGKNSLPTNDKRIQRMSCWNLVTVQ